MVSGKFHTVVIRRMKATVGLSFWEARYRSESEAKETLLTFGNNFLVNTEQSSVLQITVVATIDSM